MCTRPARSNPYMFFVGGHLSPLFTNRPETGVSPHRVPQAFAWTCRWAPQPHAKTLVHRMPFIVQCDLAGHARSLSGRRAAQAKLRAAADGGGGAAGRSGRAPWLHPSWPVLVLGAACPRPSPSIRRRHAEASFSADYPHPDGNPSLAITEPEPEPGVVKAYCTPSGSRSTPP